MIFGHLALVVAALFAGAAVYINIAEHPARLQLDDGPLLAQWKLSYKRGFAMQASLAVVGCVLGLAAWHASSDWRWGLGAIVLVSNWPFTLAVIMPVNNRLMAIRIGSSDSAMREFMQRWGRLHAMRSALGLIATGIFVWPLI